jgi:bifunctional ADP-heptose synthase (sugar kinase/adenylyltransferase)
VDSRPKIVAASQASERLAELASPVIVSGYFDPLLVSHAHRLEAARQPGRALAVIVNDPPDPVLSQRARAELVAALAAVDLVVLPDAGRRNLPEAAVRYEARDLEESTAFTAFVKERQR